MPTKLKSRETALPEPELRDVGELWFDHKNPRIALTDTPEDQDKILQVLWRDFAVDEIALSIAQNGFFPYEPLFATREGGKLVVIEGNRRLAAVKLLLDARLRKQVGATDLPSITATKLAELRTLPVIVRDRDSLWQYLAFRHVNGPQAWEPNSKSEYIAWVRNELGVPLKEIARTIGDQHQTVERLYRARMVLEQAAKAKVFTSDDRHKAHFSYSHLYTGLGYAGIQKFLGIDDKKPPKEDPVPVDKVENLGQLLVWLYGSKSKSIRPIVRSQNPDLRRLDEVLQTKQGIVALTRGLPLEVAVDLSRGDERLFREALQAAKQSLQKALGTVLTGYAGEKDLRDTGGEILQLAEKLVEELKRTKAKRSSKDEY
ncbi:MAG: ParB N-terminal domain-containing protein [Planctomycetota bacterium]